MEYEVDAGGTLKIGRPKALGTPIVVKLIRVRDEIGYLGKQMSDAKPGDEVTIYPDTQREFHAHTVEGKEISLTTVWTKDGGWMPTSLLRGKLPENP